MKFKRDDICIVTEDNPCEAPLKVGDLVRVVKFLKDVTYVNVYSVKELYPRGKPIEWCVEEQQIKNYISKKTNIGEW